MKFSHFGYTLNSKFSLHFNFVKSIETTKGLKVDLDNSKLVRLKIMDFLARREHTTKEIYQKLEKRVESLTVLEDEINKLVEEGLIDNERFAEQYIHSRSSKGYGPLRIEHELKQKGIEESISQPLMADTDWTGLAQQVLKKKAGNKLLQETKELLKIKKFLNYRGFDFSHIEKALSLHKES